MDTDEALSFLSGGGGHLFDARDEDSHVRAHQVMRGQITNKRVASRKAIAQLQSVDMSTLEESEKCCVICYNDFGVPNPEGINEAPLRLPNCKHIFGDHCIKKWFEESDSCPYCRDKVHSETIFVSTSRGLPYGIQQALRNGNRQARAEREMLLQMMIANEGSRLEAAPPSAAWPQHDRRLSPSETAEYARSRRAGPRPRHSPMRSSLSAAFGNRSALHAAMGPAGHAQQSQARERAAGLDAQLSWGSYNPMALGMGMPGVGSPLRMDASNRAPPPPPPVMPPRLGYQIPQRLPPVESLDAGYPSAASGVANNPLSGPAEWQR